MAVLVEERYKGRQSDATNADVAYIVTGTGADAGTIDDEVAFEAVLAASPVTWNGIPKANVNCQNQLVQDTIWEVVVEYRSTEPTIYTESTVDYEFNFQAASEKIYQSISTVGVYAPSGAVSANYFSGAINYNNGVIEGVDLPPGTPTNTWVFNPLHANVTDSYQAGVEAVCGCVCNVPFLGREAGTMRLVSVQGGAKFAAGLNPKWSIRFGFQHSPNRYDFYAGGIHIPYKGGHNYMWGNYQNDLNDSEGTEANRGLIPTARFIAVEQVFFEENLPLALGFG